MLNLNPLYRQYQKLKMTNFKAVLFLAFLPFLAIQATNTNTHRELQFTPTCPTVTYLESYKATYQ